LSSSQGSGAVGEHAREVRVAIVMSTYAGEGYLEAQLASLQRQSFTEWTLLVRDDGSPDATVALLERYAMEDPRIRLVRDETTRLGAPASFGVLLQAAYDVGAEYVFTCDQDDVWLEDKLESLLALVHDAEGDGGDRLPALAYSDLRVVGEDLEPLGDSFMERQRISHPVADPLPVLLAQNTVTGCAMVVNRPLLRTALPMPEVAMHDWWLAQVAAAVGVLAYLPRPTVLYRQHAANVVGARGYWGLARGAVADLPGWWRGRLALVSADARAGAST
jgi:rhamnosyltransferase